MKVFWTAKAKADLINILNFWIQHNKCSRYSKKLLQQFKSAAESIAHFPKLGVQSTIPDIRVLYSGNYEIFYKLEQRWIYKLMIWDSRRDPDKKPQL